MVLIKPGWPVVVRAARVFPPTRAVLLPSSESAFLGIAQASLLWPRMSVISVFSRSAESPHFGELLLPQSSDVIPVSPPVNVAHATVPGVIKGQAGEHGSAFVSQS